MHDDEALPLTTRLLNEMIYLQAIRNWFTRTNTHAAKDMFMTIEEHITPQKRAELEAQLKKDKG